MIGKRKTIQNKKKNKSSNRIHIILMQRKQIHIKAYYFKIKCTKNNTKRNDLQSEIEKKKKTEKMGEKKGLGNILIKNKHRKTILM